MSAFVEKKTGLEGNRTLIQSGFLAWCNVGSIFEQDISEAKLPLERGKATSGRNSGVAGVQELQNRSRLLEFKMRGLSPSTPSKMASLRARDTVYRKSSNVFPFCNS